MSKSERIVDAVFKVLEQREGFDHWWGNIFSIDQQEIREEIETEIENVLESEKAN